MIEVLPGGLVLKAADGSYLAGDRETLVALKRQSERDRIPSLQQPLLPSIGMNFTELAERPWSMLSSFLSKARRVRT